jgi:hypothetical protein
MSVIRPNAEPPVTAVAAGDIFLIDGATSVRALAATSVALRDANGNTTLNNLLEGFTSTATAAGTTTLTVASAAQQFFTGTLAQTVVLPVTSTLALGQSFTIQNESTGALTINSSGGNLVVVIAPDTWAILTCVAITGTSAASWDASYVGTIVASGKALAVSNSLTLAGTDGTVWTFPAVSATGNVATVDSVQTLTNKTLDTAGVGNVFKINGTQVSAVTGTGAAVLATSPTLVTPALGAASANALTVRSVTGPGLITIQDSVPTTTATLSVSAAGGLSITENAAAISITANSNTIAGPTIFMGVLGGVAIGSGTDPGLGNLSAKAATFTTVNGNTITTGTGVLTNAAAKTHVVSNSLTLAGTDGTTMTFQATSATIARTDAANTFTGTQTVGALVATTVNGNTFTAGTGILTIAAAKTLTINNSLTLAGTDATTQTFPTTSGTVVTSSSVSAVTNAMAAQAGAATFKGNVTAALANVADFTIQGLTNLAGPSATLDLIPIYDHVSGTIKNVTPGAIATSAVAGVSSLNGQTGALVNFHMPQGRLTLTSGTAVLSVTTSGASAHIYTPHLGNMAPIYDGINMVMTVVPEVSQLTTDTTKSPAAVAASSLYDIFVWNDAGTIRATRGPAWTNSTTRSVGTALVRVNGILLNNAAITNGPAASRGTYVGTIASNASSTIDYIFGSSAAGGGAAFFGVWNMYNRRSTSTFVNDTTGSWSLTAINTWTPFNNAVAGGVGNRISYVTGLSEDGVSASLRSLMTNSVASAAVGIAFNSITAPSGAYGFGVSTASTNAVGNATYAGPAGTGLNFLQAMEFTQSNPASFYGNLGPNQDQSALSATVWN